MHVRTRLYYLAKLQIRFLYHNHHQHDRAQHWSQRRQRHCRRQPINGPQCSYHVHTMQSSVLGKRSQSYSDFPSCVQDIPTPEPTPNPKRLKTTLTLADIHPDCNKENVPPLTISSPSTPLRRASTSIISVNERRSKPPL